MPQFAAAALSLLFLFHVSGILQSLESASLHSSSLIDSFTRDVERISPDLDCWTSNGTWKFNPNITIVDNSTYYAPCKISFYGPKNPCSWVLDGDALKHEWISNPICRSPTRRFSAPSFCSLLDGRNVLVVGDSISSHAFASWVNLLLSRLGLSCSPESNPLKPGSHVQSSRIGRCGNVTMTFVRNDRLSLATEAAPDADKQVFIETPWINQLDNISVLILNRGAHYENDTKVLSDLDATLTHLRERHPGVRVLWRNTPHGHLDWKSHVGLHEKVLDKPPELAPTHAFHYALFRRQNEAVRAFLAARFPHVLYLDVFTMTVLRADNHFDALHICAPGVADVWLEMIYNVLLLLHPSAS